MADSSESRPVARATKPVSEALLNEKWDRAISSMIIKSSLGLSFGVVFSVLLFKRRAWPAWVGLGFGAGRAWEEADARTLSPLNRGASMIRSTLELRKGNPPGNQVQWESLKLFNVEQLPFTLAQMS
ncbi:uncharacterized protein N7482_005816 [Penicillium canariense]|uniref:MICOS complex subunit MIC10 n=1 Tax=Penicillium canariense TaxID=189055 RepID=A0A9W9LNK0_9EURO|nr:uncharacterized protein N7482_005816 [Penicillium canariense]KAJ5167035.1 hypothetical protein N7482_005816 [Penicillium canariense]